jgi:hypothetical protein
MHASRQDCGFEHRVLRAIESEVITDPPDMNNAGDDLGPLLRVVQRFDLELVPAAGVG